MPGNATRDEAGILQESQAQRKLDAADDQGIDVLDAAVRHAGRLRPFIAHSEMTGAASPGLRGLGLRSSSASGAAARQAMAISLKSSR